MNGWLVSPGARRLLAATSVALAGLFGLAPAHAVLSDGFFELDGNTADPSGALLPDDWNSFNTTPRTANTPRATGIVADSIPAVFRGSKDTGDISTWRYDLGSSPPKDNMLNAYAAAYTATTATATTGIGDLLIYFGADRDSFSGTASLGFWFFKNAVFRNDATNSFVNAAGQPATHGEGDVLVAFEYTNGGAVSTVRVFKWTNGALADQGSIGVAQTNVAGIFCDPADKICGGTNGSSIALPWNGTIAPGQFFEGGINLNKLLPGGDTCFASFMATSRSSSTPNATIKNFILASFPVCKLTVSKQCVSAEFQAATSNVLNKVKGRILNDGGGTLTNISLVDNPAFDAGTLKFSTCDGGGNPTGTPKSTATLVAGDSICYTAEHTSLTLKTTDTVTASASTGGGSVTGEASATCEAPPPTTALVVTKTCDLDLELDASSRLALKVNYSGSVTNTGATLTNVKVCEVHELSAAEALLDPCDPLIPAAKRKYFDLGTMASGEVKTYGSSYNPTQALTGAGLSALLLPHTSVFKDTVGAQGTLPAILGGGIKTAVPVEATCPLCPCTNCGP